MLRRTCLVLLTLVIISGCSNNTSTASKPVPIEEQYTDYIEKTGVTELMDKALAAYKKFDESINDHKTYEAQDYSKEAKEYIEQIENLEFYSSQMEPFQDLMKEAAGYLNDSIDAYDGVDMYIDFYANHAKEESQEYFEQFNDCLDQAINWVNDNTDLEVKVEDIVEEEPQLTGEALIKDYEEKTGIQQKITYMVNTLRSMQSTVKSASSDAELAAQLYEDFDTISTFYNAIMDENDVPEPLEELYGYQCAAAGEFYRAAKCYINSLEATSQAEINKQAQTSRNYIESANSLLEKGVAWIDNYESNS